MKGFLFRFKYKLMQFICNHEYENVDAFKTDNEYIFLVKCNKCGSLEWYKVRSSVVHLLNSKQLECLQDNIE